jgi:S-DNA-T family DNA segregation ATPase FtsK/SpoIIIE
MNLATAGIRIEAPIPGLAAVGVEVPNRKSTAVRLRDMLDHESFRSASSKTTVCVGSDVTGEPVYGDIAKMPHALIAGATGMGKSVCINAILLSLLYKASPEEVKLILVDPKKVELNVYNGIPHLLVPVVVEPQKAAGALVWAVGEMERRFNMIETAGVRDIKGYNRTVRERGEKPLPQIVIVIDELNDLMMSARDAVEDSICRIAQKARAAGIHLLIGTQRPSVDVITGVIKANIPSRLAFHVSSQVDSRTILDMTGAEKLLNNGDMLFFPVGVPKPIRVQGAFVEDDEVEAVTTFLKRGVGGAAIYDDEVMANIEREAERCMPKDKRAERDDDGLGGDDDLFSDPQFVAAVEVALKLGQISTSKIQTKLRIGFQKATNYIEAMEEMGIVGPLNGSKPREVLISADQFLEMKSRR